MLDGRFSLNTIHGSENLSNLFYFYFYLQGGEICCGQKSLLILRSFGEFDSGKKNQQKRGFGEFSYVRLLGNGNGKS